MRRNAWPRGIPAAMLAALGLLAACQDTQRDDAHGDLTARLQPITDSKCGGGLAFQTIEIVNRGTTPATLRPQCVSNSPGIEVVENPASPRILAPGETGQFICALRDVGDPPDGMAENAVARLVVRYSGKEQQFRLPVTCPR